MKSSFTISRFLMAGSFALLLSCNTSNGQSRQTNLTPKAFEQQVQKLSDEVILDVRTPEEYNGGHIEGARNVDWNADGFNDALAGIDKEKPVMVYCLSGGRSGEAASAMRKAGFKQVYELKGGMMAWRNAGMPEVKQPFEAATETASAGQMTEMTRSQYDSLIGSEKAILVDFYAEWCGPCKKMKPGLDELTQELAGKVRIERIDVDKNEVLGNDLKVVGLPTLMFYKKGKLIWQQMGYMSKEDLAKRLD